MTINSNVILTDQMIVVLFFLMSQVISVNPSTKEVILLQIHYHMTTNKRNMYDINTNLLLRELKNFLDNITSNIIFSFLLTIITYRTFT